MSRPADGTIIAMRSDRLGSRLAAILNAMRLARTYGRDYRFIWPLGGHVSQELRHPEDIFDMDYFAAHVVSDAEIKPVMRGLVDLSLPNAKVTGASLAAPPVPGCFRCTAYAPLVLADEDPEAVRAQLGQMFAQMVFHPDMVDAMQAIASQMTTAASAFHIRRGDIIDDHIISNRLWRDKYIPRQFYQHYLERVILPAGQTALIFSDTPAEVDWFKAHYRDVRGVDDLMPAGLTLAQRDFLELYAMSRCREILGPPDSAYSIAAAGLGNIPIRDVRDALVAADRHDALAALTVDLESGVAGFHGLGDAGQCLPFVMDHLRDTGQPARATALMQHYLNAGLSKAYFYEMAMATLTEGGAFDDCMTAFAGAQQAVPVRMFPARVAEHWASIHRSAALASIGRGDDVAALHHLAQGIWNAGGGAAARVQQDLVHLGVVETTALTYPMDPLLRAPRPAEADLPVDLLRLYQALEIDPAQLVWMSPEDQTGRDWQDYMFTARMVEPGLAGRRLRRFFAPHCPLHVFQSALGTYLSAAGDHAAALQAHAKGLGPDPQNPLYLKRYADAHIAAGDPAAALPLLEQAATQAPDGVLYQAALAQGLAAQGDLAGAATRMTALCATGAVVPAIPQMAVEMRRKAGMLAEDLLDLVAQGQALAPTHRPLLYLKGLVQVDLGQWAAAQETLDQLLLHYGEGGDLTALARRITAQE